MRYVSIVLAILFLVLIAGCGRGGNKLIVGNIEGPHEIVEHSSAEYSVNARGDTGIAYLWAVNPQSAGHFPQQGLASIIFTASEVTSDTTILIRVVVVSDRDGPVVRSIEVTVGQSGNSPIAAAHADATEINPGEQVRFYDDSTDPNGEDDIVKWEWDFSYDPDDRFQPENNERSPVHLFLEEGLFLVQLRVTDSGGLSDMLDNPLEIMVRDPFGWPIVWGGSSEDRGVDIALDVEGNVYITGLSCADTDFDPGPEVYTHDGKVSFLSKLNPAAGLLWAVTWGDDIYESPYRPYGVTLTSEGVVAVVGNITGTYDFDPGPSVVEGTVDYPGRYLSAFNRQGIFQWGDVRSGYRYPGDPGPPSEPPTGYTTYYYYDRVSCDSHGNLYSLGHRLDMLDMGGIVSRYDIEKHDNYGSSQWTKGIGSKIKNDIAATASGHSYVVGSGDSGYTLYRIDPEGNTEWYFEYDGDSSAWRVDTDDEGNAYIVGKYIKYFGGDGSSSSFLTKFAPSGDILLDLEWAGVNYGRAVDVATGPAKNVYVVGYFTGTEDFDPGPDVFELTSYYDYSYYLMRLSPEGEFRWAETWGHVEFSQLYTPAIAVDDYGAVYIVGTFEGTIDLYPESGVHKYTSVGSTDAYVIRFGSDGSR